MIPVRVQANHAPAGQMKLVLHGGIMLEWSHPPQAAWLAELLKGLA
jgi:hypothetical protein